MKIVLNLVGQRKYIDSKYSFFIFQTFGYCEHLKIIFKPENEDKNFAEIGYWKKEDYEKQWKLASNLYDEKYSTVFVSSVQNRKDFIFIEFVYAYNFEDNFSKKLYFVYDFIKIYKKNCLEAEDKIFTPEKSLYYFKPFEKKLLESGEKDLNDENVLYFQAISLRVKDYDSEFGNEVLIFEKNKYCIYSNSKENLNLYGVISNLRIGTAKKSCDLIDTFDPINGYISSSPISSLKVSFSEHKNYQMNGATFCKSQVFIKNYLEEVETAVDYWTKKDYQKQWKEGFERIKTNNKSCIVSSVQNPEKGPFILWWLLYKVEKKVFIQQQLLHENGYFCQLDENIFTPETCYNFIPERIEPKEGEENQPLEWIVDLESF